MRIALVGLGDIAQKAYLPLLASDERVTPLLCTRNPAVLDKLARQYRIAECFTGLGDLLASRPDAVMIHAATAVHLELAAQCLRAGIPTFVDKPLCDTFAWVEELANLAMAQDCPLFVGFNRRYLPAMSAARTDNQPLTELNWQKHRHALPGLPRQFLFDDFIHVLDSLCFYGGAPSGDLHAVLRRSAQQPELLAGVSVAWQSGQVAVSGSMNRSAGITEERIDAYGDNLSLHIENCTRGTLARDKTVQTLAPDDWQSVLTQRGFAAMLAHWYQQIEAGRADGALIESYLHGHRLAERLVTLAGE
ncbi:Gfo/Idh/MocA family protein [Aeromonas hydrophila]|uniref:Gfo/Idh/MocA family protein n=1 Tax=Aeromonas hydrophila TaxID=644 RepID=UPI0005D772CD|nr:Gfo/Idh/MocA family oxidoreductase [Aeromonas hydrophila]AKA18321.1 oxidoreductase [Aeromonas hydrophila]HAT2247930.1 Gfo/Idh/MocA family oxidoreductase [Aeromonas hydrophila]HAT2383212.1 Gfo/Idh/MocA family oxidoreductase [Aeromonas hydrophila]HAT2415549.1 Gfo/Idh/MocA family oxidoreductase [Aeromonas hydrophila]HAT2526542.1 Gfo/Idh/MocA family oxidoreductase [Aeromonas hydrophila]